MARTPRPRGPAAVAPQREQPVQTLTDATSLAAMASPVRSRIIDALAVYGPSTATALATRIGHAVGSASHHLKVLAEAGLVEEAPELARDRRERWWRLVAPSTRWSRAEFAHDAAAVSAAYSAESVAMSRQFDRAREWMARSDSSSEWDSAAFATQTWLLLTPTELREFSQEQVALTRRWRDRANADDGVVREPVFVFARGFPAQP